MSNTVATEDSSDDGPQWLEWMIEDDVDERIMWELKDRANGCAKCSHLMGSKNPAVFSCIKLKIKLMLESDMCFCHYVRQRGAFQNIIVRPGCLGYNAR